MAEQEIFLRLQARARDQLNRSGFFGAPEELYDELEARTIAPAAQRLSEDNASEEDITKAEADLVHIIRGLAQEVNRQPGGAEQLRRPDQEEAVRQIAVSALDSVYARLCPIYPFCT